MDKSDLVKRVFKLWLIFSFFFFKILFFIHERQKEAETQREKQAPCGEPDAGLDSSTPRSRPEPKADAQPLSHPGVPYFQLFARV